MKRHLLALITGLSLTACSPPTTVSGLSMPELTQLDAAARGGLSDSTAAHPSVQLAQPYAYALTAESVPFLQALSRQVGPQRVELADRLAADATVTQGLASWERSSTATRFALLERISAIASDVFGCPRPTLIQATSNREQPGTMASFLDDGGTGRVTLYMNTIAGGGQYLAVATLVHELRHAAQSQLVKRIGLHDTDTTVLIRGYDAALDAIEALGGQDDLAYGDYVHLNIEYDAFATGNHVASLLSGGSYDAAGIGFVDTQYDSASEPKLDLLGLTASVTGASLIASVNKAQYEAERKRGGSVSMPRQRHQDIGFRRRR